MRITAPSVKKITINVGDVLVSGEGIPHMLVSYDGNMCAVNLSNGNIVRHFDHIQDVSEWVHSYRYLHYPRDCHEFHLEII